MKKKFLSLILIMIMCMSVFTGCSLVERNDKNYYEATVATISYVDGTKDEIDKRELITAYNSYGYNYVNNYNYTKEEAIKQTLETIINKRLTIKAVENYYKKIGEDMLIESETTYLWDQTYESLYSNLKSYLEGAVDGTDSTSPETDKSVYTPYKKTVYLDEDLTIRKFTPASTTRATYTARQKDGVAYNVEYKNDDGKFVFKELIYNKLYDIVGENNVSSEKKWKVAFNKYISDIKSNYSYVDFKDDKDCFMFEIDRVYDILKSNYMVEKYEVIYNVEKSQDYDISAVTSTDVLKAYSAKVRADYTTYVVEGDTSSFASSILSDIANVDYILEGNGISNYFYVAPIKIEFSQTQKDQISAWQEQVKAGYITQTRCDELIETLYSSLSANIRNAETGEKTTSTISAENLLSAIKSDVANYQYDASLGDDYNKDISYKKAEAYRKYLYLYNDDDSLKGADYNTVFGIDANGNVLANDTYKDNEEIENAIISLYNQGNAKVGDVSDLVKVDDGYYIFFFAGNVENLFAVTDMNFDASKQIENIKVLSSTRLNVFSTKTVFDAIYEGLSKDNFSIFENMNIDYLRTTLASKIESVGNNIEDLYK